MNRNTSSNNRDQLIVRVDYIEHECTYSVYQIVPADELETFKKYYASLYPVVKDEIKRKNEYFHIEDFANELHKKLERLLGYPVITADVIFRNDYTGLYDSELDEALLKQNGSKDKSDNT